MEIQKTDKLYVVSDLHIVHDEVYDDVYDGFPAQAHFIAFIEEIGKDPDARLLLLGDLFDLWQMEGTPAANVGEIIDAYPRMFGAIRTFAKTHLIQYMPGNHDHAVLNDRDVHALLKECGLDIVEESLLTLDIRSKDGGCVKIAAEHGHAGDPYNNYEHPDRAEATSFSQHVWRLFVWPAKSLDRLHDSWMQDIDNVHPVSVIPWWVLSQYFYRDMGWMLKALVVPAAFLFSLTKVGIILLCLRLFGIDLVSAGLPPVPTPLLYLLLGLFGIDLFVFMLLLLLNFVRRDARRALRRWGVDGNLEEALERSRESALIRAGKVLDETQADMYLFGHTHEEHIGCRNAQVICNVGTWTKRMRRIRSRFHLPPVFVPEFRLTYARMSASDEGVRIELRQRPMHMKPELTYLERFATMGRRGQEPGPDADSLLDEIGVRSSTHGGSGRD
jgi:UDP-2,3-diacylglucosamine pyrophosphatase LpxH